MHTFIIIIIIIVVVVVVVALYLHICSQSQRTAVEFVFSVDAVGDAVAAEKPRDASKVALIAGEL